MSIRILQFWTLIISIIGIWYYGIFDVWISLILYFIINVFVGNAMMHRYYSHKGYELRPYLIPLSRWLCHHLIMGSVVGWAAYHRLHHQHSDTDNDIHSPIKQGLIHIIFGVWKTSIPKSVIKDLITPKLMWWHNNYITYHAILSLILLILSPWTLVFVYAIPNLLSLVSANIIAILPHLTGEVKNSTVTELITLGEGNHKFHHDNPKEIRYGKFDLTGIVIEKFLKI